MEVFVRFSDNLPQPVFEADAQGVMTYVNRNGAEILGYEPGELPLLYRAWSGLLWRSPAENFAVTSIGYVYSD